MLFIRTIFVCCVRTVASDVVTGSVEGLSVPFPGVFLVLFITVGAAVVAEMKDAHDKMHCFRTNGDGKKN